MADKKKNAGQKAGKGAKLAAALLLIAVSAGLLLYAFKTQKDADSKIEGAGTADHAVVEQTALTHDGKNYPLKNHISTLLVMGTDTYADTHDDDDGLELYYNYVQSDFMTVLVFDDDAKTCTPLQLNRETMCNVDRLSVNGKVRDQIFCQLTLAHTYGTGKEDSCVNVRNAVSRLLCDAPIENYIAFTMDAIPAITDMVGGVQVTLEDDLTDIDPSFVKGNTVTLTSANAERFVRTRSMTRLEGNIERMGRHRQYLRGFTEAARNAAEQDSGFTLKSYDELSPYITTDLSATNISEYSKKLGEYEILDIITPEGELRMGERYAEFYPDEDDVWSKVKSLWCR